MRITRFLKKCYDEEENLLILNTYTGDLLKINNENINNWEMLLNNPNKNINETLFNYMYNKNIIIDDDINEDARTELQYFEIAHSNRKLLLTILPTEDCNFRCPYCYEEHNIGKMEIDVIEGIKKFVKSNLRRYDMLQVNWFGGEPLEALDIIIELSEFFIRICGELHIPYRASMTTNGYLLDKETFNKLYKLHIVDYQITLDGLENTHNISRPYKNGTGTYKTILSNLFSIRDQVKTYNVNITIRTNITRSVMEEIDQHINFLEREFGEDSRFSVIFKIAWSNEKDIQFNQDELLPTGELKSVLNKCVGKKLKFSINRGQICFKDGICYAAHSNALVFGANGQIYKCTVEYKKDINQVGTIDKNGKLKINKDKWAFWVMKTPFKGGYEKCSKCFFQPACMGVYCPINRFNEKGEHQCVGMKDYVEIYMKLCAQNKNMIEEVE